MMARVFVMINFLAAIAWTEIQTPPMISGHDENQIDSVLPADVLSRVKLVASELELTRVYMGRPKNFQPEIKVEGAAPREVYYQAMTLLRKANRLSFENSRVREREPTIVSADQLKPAHVWKVVDLALKQIMRVNIDFGIKTREREVESPVSTKPNDVFIRIIQVNRQLNLLLDQRYSPSDVYQQVSASINHTMRLLANFKNTRRVPKETVFIPGKKPTDVYSFLIIQYKKLEVISKLSGLKILKLEEDPKAIKNKTPSDVYDLASLLLSELAYIHANTKADESPVKAYYPGRKLPSHVYQRVGVLENLLDSLHEKIKVNPSWLKN